MSNTIGVLRVLHRFFRWAAPVLVACSLAFSVDSHGKLWMMWRDDTLLAVTLDGLALAMAAGWIYTGRRLRIHPPVASERAARESAGPEVESIQPYNIWRQMDPGVRRRLALAVFLIFGTIGPLSLLMQGRIAPVQPLTILILTVSSGGISACIILFGRKPALLIPSVLLCLCGNLFQQEVTDFFVTPHPAPFARNADGSVIVPAALQSDIEAERTAIGILAIGLLSLGYVMFIVVLSREGRRRLQLQSEVAIARRIQRSLLPSETFRLGSIEVAGSAVPASEVAGDYFDVFTPQGEAVAVAIADVAGHGVGAGILAAMTKSALHSQVAHSPLPGDVLKNLNRTLYQMTSRNMFVTFAYVLFDPLNRQARIATAGHPPVLQYRRSTGDCAVLRTPSLGLGLHASANFGETVVEFSPGDRFLLYTDGVTESTNQEHQQFGLERLTDLLRGTRARNASAVCEEILESLRSFTGSSTGSDDLTVVCAQITDGQGSHTASH
jgi:serine phosphatase RsbU (regulator of sigma subunit)